MMIGPLRSRPIDASCAASQRSKYGAAEAFSLRNIPRMPPQDDSEFLK